MATAHAMTWRLLDVRIQRLATTMQVLRTMTDRARSLIQGLIAKEIA
jgi:hypothetical protein